MDVGMGVGTLYDRGAPVECLGGSLGGWGVYARTSSGQETAYERKGGRPQLLGIKILWGVPAHEVRQTWVKRVGGLERLHVRLGWGVQAVAAGRQGMHAGRHQVPRRQAS